MSQLILKEFIKSVPFCKQTASLDSLLALFETSQVNEIAIVSEGQSPLGVVRLCSLLSYLASPVGVRFKSSSFRKSSNNQWRNRQDSFGEVELMSLREPIATLPDSMELQEVLPYLQNWQLQSEKTLYCAVVNKTGKFLGLLDSWRLLQQLQPKTTISPFSQNHQTYLSSLLPLLEQLPLPLMVQSLSGTVIHQNSAWRDQVSEFWEEQSLPITPYNSNVAESQTGQWEDRDANLWCNVGRDARNLDVGNLLETRISERKELFKRVWQFTRLPLPLSEDSSLVYLVFASEVTEQQHLCQELSAKNADLRQLNRMKDEFLACISHELKTPLTVILGLSSLLKDQSLGELNPRQERYARMVHQSGRQLMMVVNDLLDLTQLETGQLSLHFQPVKVQAVCDRAYSQTLKLVKEKDSEVDDTAIDFTLEIESGLETLVADELRLRQMLIHLLSNALKFTQGKGTVGLRVSYWQGWVAFQVWDTGIGIPVESQHLIFQKFQQLENPLTRQFEGTGLGLVLTQRLARAHGGEISFISKEGEGSEFTLLLPPSPCEKSGNAASSSFPSVNRLVLIVEAMAHYIEPLHEHLQQLGYSVAIARSGTEALEKARQLQPCAILLNPVLPLLSGWDVLTLLKADSQTCNIPVFITAPNADKNQTSKHRANGFLSLPINPQELKEKLQGDSQNIAPKHLTILHLKPYSSSPDAEIGAITDELNLEINSSTSSCHYRLLEAEDLDQADILAHLWHPQAILLEEITPSHALDYLQSLSQHKSLARLPIITLDAKTTEVANQVYPLSVFPCLVPPNEQRTTTLLEVIQVATRLNRK